MNFMLFLCTLTPTTKARNLRKNQTDVEQILWQQLRSRQLLNCKFRRQMPFAPYIVDFICLDHHLIIELDGSQHQEQKAYDEKQSAFLREHGFTVLRFWNNEVIENLAGVLETIRLALQKPSRT